MLAHFEGGASWAIGSEQDLETSEAVRLIKAGHAVPVGEIPLERAVKAATPERRKRRGGNALA